MSKPLIALLIFAASGYGQDTNTGAGRAPAEKAPREEPALLHRLETVTWNPVTAELSWVVSIWDAGGDATQRPARQSYTLHIDEAIMKAKGEQRGFDPEEARRLRVLMDLVSTYAVVSTVWWDEAESERLDYESVPSAGPKEKDAGKEHQTKPALKAPAVVLRGPVAVAQPAPQPATLKAVSH